MVASFDLALSTAKRENNESSGNCFTEKEGEGGACRQRIVQHVMQRVDRYRAADLCVVVGGTCSVCTVVLGKR